MQVGDSPGKRARGEDETAPRNVNEFDEDEEVLVCSPVVPGGSDEAVVPKIAKNPGDPTRREREEHDITHLPYRSWCRTCVEAKGKEDPHKKVSEIQPEELPIVSMDYAFMSQEDQEGQTKIIVIKDQNQIHILPRGGQERSVREMGSEKDHRQYRISWI